MSMERWNPFRDMDMMRQAMDRWFDDRFPERGSMMSGTGQNLSVAIDLHETDNGYELTASLPGVRPEDIDITVNRDSITLRGRSEQNEEHKQGNYIYHERRSGSFQRTIRLPEPVNSEQIEAELDHGVLRVTMPRLQQTPNRRVQVRPGMMGSQSLGSNQSSGATMSGTPGMSGMANTSMGNQSGMSAQSSSMGSGSGMSGSIGSSTSGQSGMSSSMGSSTSGQSSMSGSMGSQGSGTTSGMTSTGPNVGETGTSGGGAFHGSTSSQQPRTSSTSMSGSGSMSGSMERPSVMNNMSSTQMDELERHARDNNEQGFRSQANSYGWDRSTVDQIWNYMSRRATGDEARRAFENQNQSSDPSQRPTNSL